VLDKMRCSGGVVDDFVVVLMLTGLQRQDLCVQDSHLVLAQLAGCCCCLLPLLLLALACKQRK